MNGGVIKLRVDRFSDRKAGHPNQPSTQILLGTIVGDSVMKKIPLTQGQFAIVDDEDFEELNQHKWCLCRNGNNLYAIRFKPNPATRKQTCVYIHRIIMGEPKGMSIDHINHNALDNRKVNLRICSNADNIRNQQHRSDGSSKYRGVCWDKGCRKWKAQIKFKGKTLWLGTFGNETDAARIYDEKANELYGEFANLNFKELDYE